jgi:hypothetical protein
MVSRVLIIIVILMFLPLWPAGTSGQSLIRVVPGLRIRVQPEAVADSSSTSRTWRQGNRRPYIVGCLTAIGATSLALKPSDSDNTVNVERSTIKWVDISRGQKNRLMTGASAGLLIGACAGGVIGGCVDAFDGISMFESSSQSNDNSTLIGLGVGAAAGLVVGAIMGHHLSRERWKRIPIEDFHMELRVYGSQGLSVTTAVPI